MAIEGNGSGVFGAEYNEKVIFYRSVLSAVQEYGVSTRDLQSV